MRSKPNCLNTLQAAGFDYEDACALRRIAMTLHRWHELECGDSNQWGSWAIERGKKRCISLQPYRYTLDHDPDHADGGEPYMVHHAYGHAGGQAVTSYTKIADRERGALKRLAAIMARYPQHVHYVQGDPRGPALYILRPEDYANAKIECEEGKGTWTTFGEWLSANYSRGVAVFK